MRRLSPSVRLSGEDLINFWGQLDHTPGRKGEWPGQNEIFGAIQTIDEIDCATPPGGVVWGNPEGKATRGDLIQYFNNISGRYTLSGQHNREPNSEPWKWSSIARDITGVFPGLWGGDFLFLPDDVRDRQIMIDEAVRSWEAGSVVALKWHVCPPTVGETCDWNDEGILAQLSDTDPVCPQTPNYPDYPDYPQNPVNVGAVRRVSIHWEAADAPGFQIQSSLDEEAWTTVHENYNGSGGVNDGSQWASGWPGPDRNPTVRSRIGPSANPDRKFRSGPRSGFRSPFQGPDRTAGFRSA
ncbi:hypothetical protein Fcan01_23616 [Folsomia candida]|uniref:GH26 domain-containing protein n=1 Tax=Folsomia candida TaxID=158441 RepID=A0A226D9Y8_FOLCA|nr:hypothetical protein Fcan01_23616 [Folsomia candida]